MKRPTDDVDASLCLAWRRRAASAAAGVLLVLLAAGSIAPRASADEGYRTGTPLETVETLHDGLVSTASQIERTDLDERYERLRPLIEATHDLPYIAQVVLRAQWRGLSADEREAFIDAFERLSVMTYASRFAGLTADTLRIVQGSDADADRAEVSAAIVRPDAQDIPLEYVLHQGRDGWRIINIVADGVSDLALKRAEYQRVLADGSIERLVRHIEEQTARLGTR